MSKREILALTLIQPWATLIAQRYKPVENRTWRPEGYGLRPGGFIAIHAGVWSGQKTEREWDAARELAQAYGLAASIPILAAFMRLPQGGPRDRASRQPRTAYCKGAVPYGAIVAVARLGEVRMTARVKGGNVDPWFCGPVGWYMDQVTPIDPVACKGAQSLWAMSDDVLAQVRDRYEASRPPR